MADQPPIFNAKDRPIGVAVGGLPNVNAALGGWMQPMVFGRVTKTPSGYQVVETEEAFNFRGVIQPLSARQIAYKPEGQRAWTWLMLHADPSLTLNVDDVVTYLGKQTRITARKNYTNYGYVYYELVQDWEGSGPTEAAP